MKFFTLSALITALLFTFGASAQAANNCSIEYNKAQDLRDFLFERAANAMATSQYLSDDVRVTGWLSDDHTLPVRGSADPVARLREIMQPISFRQARQNGVLHVSGDACGDHGVEFEATTIEPNEVWELEVTFQNGLVQSVQALRLYYSKVDLMEKSNG